MSLPIPISLSKFFLTKFHSYYIIILLNHIYLQIITLELNACGIKRGDKYEKRTINKHNNS